MTEDKKPKFFYGYIIVLAGLIIQLIAWGTYSTFGVFFTPLLDEFGWTRATLSGVNSLAYILMGFTGVIVGRLGDRFGPRMTMVGCGLFFGLGYLLTSQVNAIWQLYLSYSVLLGVGMSGVDILPLSTVARWFVKKRGIMTGAIKVGAGLGMVIMPIVANQLILAYDWRSSYIVLGIISLALLVSVPLLLRRDPSQKGLLPYGEGEASNNGLNVAHSRFSLREAVRTRSFWTIAAIYFLFVFCVQTVLVHIDPYAQGIGISATNAANILAIIGGASIIARIIMGTTGDRIGHKWGTTICLVIYVVSFSWLLFAGELWMLYLFALIYGFAHGGFFALISPLLAELFGLSSHGVIFGIVIFSGTIGGALGPLLAGRIFDVTGGYQLVFLICAVVSVVALILSLLLKPTGGKSLQPVSGI